MFSGHGLSCNNYNSLLYLFILLEVELNVDKNGTFGLLFNQKFTPIICHVFS